MSSKWKHLKIPRAQECPALASRQTVAGGIGQVLARLPVSGSASNLGASAGEQGFSASATDLRRSWKSRVSLSHPLTIKDVERQVSLEK